MSVGIQFVGTHHYETPPLSLEGCSLRLRATFEPRHNRAPPTAAAAAPPSRQRDASQPRKHGARGLSLKKFIVWHFPPSRFQTRAFPHLDLKNLCRPKICMELFQNVFWTLTRFGALALDLSEVF